MDDTSLKKPINKNFFVFHPILMKLTEVVVVLHCYTWAVLHKFHQNGMKNKKVLLLIAYLMDTTDQLSCITMLQDFVVSKTSGQTHTII